MASTLPSCNQAELSRVLYIQVDGSIGAGKSFFIEHVLSPIYRRQGYVIINIPEPVDQWKEILKLFYEDPARWAYTFQGVALFHRTIVIREAYEKLKLALQTTAPEKIVIISERGCASDLLFGKILIEQGSISPLEAGYYYQWCAHWQDNLPGTPNLILYVRTPVDICHKRISERNREGEKPITKEYLTKLENVHDDWLVSGPRGAHECVVVVDFSQYLSTLQELERCAVNVSDRIARVWRTKST